MAAIVTVAEIKQYMNIAADDTSDDVMIGEMIEAAQEWAEDYCGHSLATNPDDAESTTPPKKFKQALYFLVSHWYENREILSFANTIPRELPFNVTAILNQTRRIPL